MKRTIFLGIIGIFFLGLFLVPRTSTVFAVCVNGDPMHFSGCPPFVAGNTGANAVNYSSYIYQCAGVSIPRCCTSSSDCTTVVPTTTTGSKTSTPPTPNTCSLLQGAQMEDCNDCMVDDKHVWTAVGCIEATSTGLVNKFLPLGIGIAGGIAFLLILFGALQIMMSAGNPEKLNAGKELITAAITGLLLIIFSVFLLQLIGVKILAIPGFK